MMHHFRFDGLARRLILMLILFSSFITALITAYDLYADYRRDMGQIDSRIRFIRDSYLPTLVESVWVGDSLQIATQLDGLARLQDIEYLSISVGGQERWHGGKLQSRRTISSDIPLLRHYRDQQVTIGTLHVSGSVDNVLERLWDKLVTTLLRNFIKTLLIAGFMLYMFQYLAGRHLEKIARHLQLLGQAPATTDTLKLDRTDSGRQPPDVLDKVVVALNSMQMNLGDSLAHIKALNEALDQRVKDRTAELRLQNLRNEAILGSTPDGFFSTDASGRIHDANPAFCAMLGYSGAELSRMSIQDIEARERPLETAAHMQKILTEKYGRFDTRHRRKNGTTIEVEISISLVEIADEQRFYVFVRDITPRKAAEAALTRARDEAEQAVAKYMATTQRLNNAQQMARLGDYDFDLQTGQLIWSDAIYGLLGLAPGSVPPSMELFAKALHPDDAAVIGKQMLEAFSGSYPDQAGREISLPDLEYRVLHPDGSVRWLHSAGYAQIDSGGKLSRAWGPVQDITLRKQQELTLIAARDEAERANAAKNDFLSRMSHELRTPLNAILGFAQLMEMERDPPLAAQQYHNLQHITQAGQHLLQLINEVLDLSRIESGKLDITLEQVELLPLVKSCVMQLQPLADKRKIRVTLELDQDYRVEADLLRLREVLNNLLSNAIKYNREGGEIHIRCRHTGNNRIRTSIQDNGYGIAPDALPRLFRPFERLESATNGIEGTGIGLALCKRLLEGMQGMIGVDSMPGSGSTFWFELALALSGSDNLAAAPRPAMAPAHSHTDIQQKILYVEDNPANMMLMRKIIALRRNWLLLEAADAESGLLLAETALPDAILLDINLPGMDGYEALRYLRSKEQTRNIPVVAVSANAMLGDIERGRAAGFDDYITKPVNVSHFFAILERILQRPEGS